MFSDGAREPLFPTQLLSVKIALPKYAPKWRYLLQVKFNGTPPYLSKTCTVLTQNVYCRQILSHTNMTKTFSK